MPCQTGRLFRKNQFPDAFVPREGFPALSSLRQNRRAEIFGQRTRIRPMTWPCRRSRSPAGGPAFTKNLLTLSNPSGNPYYRCLPKQIRGGDRHTPSTAIPGPGAKVLSSSVQFSAQIVLISSFACAILVALAVWDLEPGPSPVNFCTL